MRKSLQRDTSGRFHQLQSRLPQVPGHAVGTVSRETLRMHLPKMFCFGLSHLPFKNLLGDGRLIDIKEGDVAKANLMQNDDELDEVRVRLLPERFLALAKEVV